MNFPKTFNISNAEIPHDKIIIIDKFYKDISIAIIKKLTTIFHIQKIKMLNVI